MRGAGWLLGLVLAGAAHGAAPDPSAPFLWQVQGAKARHYVMGSVHLLPPSAHPLPAGLGAAYSATEGLVLESDLSALAKPDMQMELLSRATAAEGLRSAVPAALYRRLEQRAAQLGMPLSMCESYKAWFCALTLEVFNFQHHGFRPELGIDQHFLGRALDDRKSVGWLERPQEHLGLFFDMPPAMSEQFLAATLEELTETGTSPEELLRVWRSSDLAAMERLARQFKARHPLAYDRLLASRNRRWAERMQPLFAGAAPQLVIVGAAHLAGPENLIGLLQGRGYAVVPAVFPALREPKATPPSGVPAPIDRGPGAAVAP